MSSPVSNSKNPINIQMSWKEVGAFTCAALGTLCLLGGIDKSFDNASLEKMNQVCCKLFDEVACARSTKPFSDFALNVTQVCATEIGSAIQETTKKEIAGYLVGSCAIIGLIATVVIYAKCCKKREYEEIPNA